VHSGGLGFEAGPGILTTPALARAIKSNRRALQLIKRSYKLVRVSKKGTAQQR